MHKCKQCGQLFDSLTFNRNYYTDEAYRLKYGIYEVRVDFVKEAHACQDCYGYNEAMYAALTARNALGSDFRQYKLIPVEPQYANNTNQGL